MRPIKFRAYDPNKKNMTRGATMKETCLKASVTNFYWDEEVILMQYTGLNDKNGKEIYEGDILKLGNTCSFVVWSLDGWRFNSYMERGTLDLYPYVDRTNGKEVAEVIGNIYQHKHLLK